VLYGIYTAKQSIAKENNCYLVEGYTDVIQFFQTGIHNVVSSSGTALTPDQIRLVNRLTTNITVLFDGDAAGLRASLRGVDLILEQGMNVKICTFPEGEDPDSFARSNSLEDLTLYLQEKSQDFISFKASLLASEAKNDPVKKADTIRDMVVSISKIPDVIKREVYIQECSRIMDISEEVLFNTLAQILQKEQREASRRPSDTKPMEVVPQEKQVVKKVDAQYELERKIIELLLLYGDVEEEFEDLILEQDEKGEIAFKPEIVKSKVFEKIYLDLQDDEIEFANEDFKGLYFEIITKLNQEQDFQIDTFMNELQPDMASAITDILMDDERYTLHDWERNDIYVTDKSGYISQVVSETILNLRRQLVTQKIGELSEEIKIQETVEKENSLQDIVDYITLKKVLSEKLRRVL
jgi:DNA primase